MGVGILRKEEIAMVSPGLTRLPGTLVSEVIAFVRQTVEYYFEHRVTSMAAALAFYTTFSLAPGLLIALAVAEIVMGSPTPESELARMMNQYIGEEATSYALSAMATSRAGMTGSTATLIGLGTVVFGATVVFMELQGSLNSIWEVTHEGGSGLLRSIYARLTSFLLVVCGGLLLVVSLVLSTAMQVVEQYVSNLITFYPTLFNTPNLIISWVMIPSLLAMLYRLLPDTDILWRDVWFGTLVSTLLFAAGKYGFGLYLGRTTLVSIYGAAGSFVIILLWVYYSSQVLLLGAELTRVYAERYGSRVHRDVGEETE
ncbi:YihY/virulence factor BrkB family protein [Thermodesulfobacteriota bacterium]